MKLPLHTLPLLLSLASCASTTAERVAPDGSSLERFSYRTAVERVPPGASSVVLRVHLPGPAGAVRALRASGLVGNAPFEVAIPANAGAFRGEHVELSWGALEQGGREVMLLTHGRPFELGLCFGLDPSMRVTPADVLVMQQELTHDTVVAIDDQPAPGPRVQFERVR